MVCPCQQKKTKAESEKKENFEKNNLNNIQQKNTFEPTIKNQESYTITFPDKTSHTFYWWKQEMYRNGDLLYSNIDGTIFVYNTTKLNPADGNYQIVKTIQYRSNQTPMIYPETILTPGKNPFVNNIEQSYTIYQQKAQQKQFDNIDPVVAARANIIKPQDMNVLQTYNFQYNPETRMIFDGFNQNQVEFAHDF